MTTRLFSLPIAQRTALPAMRRGAFLRLLFVLCCGLLLLGGCGSRKQQRVVLPADIKGPKELARLYGVRITDHDNI